MKCERWLTDTDEDGMDAQRDKQKQELKEKKQEWTTARGRTRVFWEHEETLAKEKESEG